MAGITSVVLAGWTALTADSPADPILRDQPAASRAADAPPKSGIAPKTVQPKAQAPASGIRDLDMLKVPAGAILVICREAKEALKLIPEGVLLTPEKYQSLLERIEQLERLSRGTNLEIPSACKLTGYVEGDLVRFQARFDFRTERPNTTVSLGCQRAWLRPGAALDGQLPLLSAAEDGLIKVLVETPGIHQLTMDMELPLIGRGAKGGEQGFDLGLPKAAITTLEGFSFSRSVAEVRINGRSVQTKNMDGGHARVDSVPLGPAERLEMSWKGPAARPQKSPPVLEAVGRLTVRVHESAIITDVELTLQSLAGETRAWRVQMPPQLVLEVKEPRLQDERIESIEPPQPKNPFLTIRLKEPSSEPLRVVFQVRQPRLQTAVAVGPFTVPGASRQRGTIGVTAPPDLRVRFQRRGDVMQRDISDESRRESTIAEFSYGIAPPSQPGQLPPAPLELMVEEIKGSVETRVEHNLMLSDAGVRIMTKLLVTPVRIKVDRLEISVPAGYQYERDIGAAPTDLVDSVELSEPSIKPRMALVKLVKQQSQPFTLTLPGVYPLVDGARRAVLELPRPTQVLDRGGQVTASLPDGLEFTAESSGPDLPMRGQRRQTWSFDRIPSKVTLMWRPHRPELSIDGVADVTVTGRQVRVRQELRLHFSVTERKLVTLVVPPSIAPRLRLVEGGTLEADGRVRLPAGAPKEHTLVLAYSFPLKDQTEEGPDVEAPREKVAPAVGPFVGRFTVPLIQVIEATQFDTKVRVWSESGTLPVLAQEGWEEQPIEAVKERQALPALVLRNGGLTAPLILKLAQGKELVANVIVERVLIRVAIGEGGRQSYRARFRVKRFNNRTLTIDFPGSLAGINPVILLDGKRLLRLEAAERSAADNQGATTARLEIEPDLYAKPVLLEICFELPPRAQGAMASWLTTVRPPCLGGDLLLGSIRWQIELPAGHMSFVQRGGNTAEQQWIWHGGLLTPEPAVTSGDLDRWLMANADDSAAEDMSAPGQNKEPNLVCWQTAAAALQLVHAPRQAWLLICSLFFLLVGLALSLAPLPRGLWWLVLMSVAVGATVGAVFWPDALPAVAYGCEPGAAVLVLILAVQWLLQHRYRRQVIFMPSFTRVKAGSSISRREAGPPPMEPSTVDAPKKRENSIKASSPQNTS
jgi:hypothetical protein